MKSEVLLPIALLLLIILVAGAAGLGYLFYSRHRQSQEKAYMQETLRVQRMKEREFLGREDIEKLPDAGNVIIIEIKKDKSGEIVIKTGKRLFGSLTDNQGSKRPDYKALHDYVVARKTKCAGQQDSANLRIILDADKEVDFQHVIHALNECVRAGVSDISFAAPELSKQE